MRLRGRIFVTHATPHTGDEPGAKRPLSGTVTSLRDAAPLENDGSGANPWVHTATVTPDFRPAEPDQSPARCGRGGT